MYQHSSEPITFERDCEVVLVPSGDEVILPAGTMGYITQALGGSFTLYVEGNLFRLAGTEADAIGKPALPVPTLPDNAGDAEVEALIWEQLRTCYDPEIPVSIVELGLIYECEVTPLGGGDRRVDVEMTLTAPGCGMGDILVEDVRSKLLLIPTVSQAEVELVFDPPWNQTMMSEAARLEVGLF